MGCHGMFFCLPHAVFTSRDLPSDPPPSSSVCNWGLQAAVPSFHGMAPLPFLFACQARVQPVGRATCGRHETVPVYPVAQMHRTPRESRTRSYPEPWHRRQPVGLPLLSVETAPAYPVEHSQP